MNSERGKKRELSGWEENSLSAVSFGFDDGHAELCEHSAAFWNFPNKLSETQHSEREVCKTLIDSKESCR